MSVLPLLPGAELLACVPRLRRYARALVGERTAADHGGMAGNER